MGEFVHDQGEGMKDEYAEESRSTDRRVRGWARVLLYGLLVAGVCVGGFQVMKGVSLARRSDAEKTMVAQLEEARRRDVAKNVEGAVRFLEIGDLVGARRSLKMAKGLDVEGRRSADIERVRLRYLEMKEEAEVARARREKIRGDLEGRVAGLRVKIANAQSMARLEALESSVEGVDQVSDLFGDDFNNEVRELEDSLRGRAREVLISELGRLTRLAASGLRSGQIGYEESLQLIEDVRGVVSEDELPEDRKLAAKALLERLEENQGKLELEKRLEAAIEQADWAEAEKVLAEYEAAEFDEVEILRKKVEVAKAERVKRDEEVAELMKKVKEMDDGNYNGEALLLLEKVLEMDPEHAAARTQQLKMMAYARVLRVPGDVASLDEALALAKSGDRVVLGEGTYFANSKIENAIALEGAGADKTTLENGGENGAALWLELDAGQARISKLKLRGKKYLKDDKRHALMLVEGDVLMEDCEVERSAGHGIALLRGKLDMKRCKVTQCGWDGVTVKGEESHVVLTDCVVSDNFEHGVDFWEGAVGTVFRSQVQRNGKAGIVVIGAKSRVTVANVLVQGNRDAGLFLAGGALVHLDRVTSRGNGFSGVVIQDEGTRVKMTTVRAEENGEAGYVIDPASLTEGVEEAEGEKNQQGRLLERKLPR